MNNYQRKKMDSRCMDEDSRIRVEKLVEILKMSVDPDKRREIAAFQEKADDGMTMPFEIGDSTWRIGVELRKTSNSETMEEQTKMSERFTIRPEQRRIFKGGKPVLLTSKEYKICEMLLNSRNRVVTRNEIFYNIWDSADNVVNDGTLNVHICRIRKKLECSSCIETVRDVGYRWGCCKRDCYK
ncbi:response regulator transcription factor [Blautia liquoris]|uniref:Response regulator transcription factor n=1 Tax=Blautia liquoris TaxID=2779518 RepID=A0A7M2RIM6_9FIRM|nr:response regulator transcription factor [Blautia liquoris]QOV19844.1 response regulator transcription factor [Blautia liquoris]